MIGQIESCVSGLSPAAGRMTSVQHFMLVNAKRRYGLPAQYHHTPKTASHLNLTYRRASFKVICNAFSHHEKRPCTLKNIVLK